MAKVNLKTAALSLAGMMCFAHLSTVSAQTAGSAKEPTADQAREFITSMIEQHSSSSCEKKSDDLHQTFNTSYLARIDGNRITIQKMIKIDSDTILRKNDIHRMWGMTSIETTTGLLSEVMAKVNEVVYHYSFSNCGVAHDLELHCKDSTCLKEKRTITQSHSLPEDQLHDGTEVKNLATALVSIHINDASIAERIVKAVKFYQEHSPAAAPSPF